MSTDPADRRLLAAVATRLTDLATAMGGQQSAFGALKDEVRELTDAAKVADAKIGALLDAGDKRGKQATRLLDRLTRLSLVQAGAMLMAALSVPVALAGTVLAVRDPARVLDTVVLLVDAIPFVEVEPTVREAPDATP